MKREEAYEYWRYKYEMAKDFDDPRWEGGEIREFRRYVDALATIVKMLEPPTCNADRIRGMTDEELADFLTAIMDCCGNGACGTFCPMWKCCYDQPSDNVEGWLKSPVEVDDG